METQQRDALPLERLEAFRLAKGAHDDRSGALCAMELVSWMAGEKHSDHPACVSPVLGAFVRRWNDDLDDEGRQRLKPLLPLLMGTNDGRDEERAWMAADWLVRVHTPAWLELAGVTESAAALRALPALENVARAERAAAPLRSAREKAAAAGAAAWAAARDAAWNAARDAAWDAARDAAWDAAWNAAWEKLKPTKVVLQDSALELLERMARLGKAA